MSHQFPNNLNTFKDTQNRGSIGIGKFLLTADADGFVECPADYTDDLKAHGFVPMARPTKTVSLPAKK